MDVMRNLFVWLFFLSIGQETFTLLQFSGFTLLVLGNLIYNEIIEFKILNANEHLALEEE